MRLGHLFCALPWSEDFGYRVNLFSAAGAAWAAGLLCWLVARATNSPGAGLLTGLGFAWLRSVWRQAVIAEVFGLHFALLASLAALAWLTRQRLEQDRPFRVPLGAVYLVLGLCLAHHHTLLLAVPGLLWLARGHWKRVFVTPLWLLALGVALVLYLDMLGRARAEPALNWGGLQTTADLWGHFLRRAYGTFQLTSKVQPLENGLVHTAGYGIFTVAQQAPWPWLLLGLWGLVATRRRWPDLWGLGVLWWIFMGAFFALIGRQGEDAFHLDLLERFYAGSYLGLALLIGLGAADLFSRVAGRWVAWLSSMTLLIALLVSNLGPCRLDGPELVVSYAQLLLEGCPPGAVLFVNGDLPVGALEYVQKVQGQRPDVHLICPGLLGSRWYRDRLPVEVQRWLPDPTTPEGRREQFLAEQARTAGAAVVCNQKHDWPGVWQPVTLGWRWQGAVDLPGSTRAVLRDALQLGNGLGQEGRFWPRFLVSARISALRQHAARIYSRSPHLALAAMQAVLDLGGQRALDTLNLGLLQFELSRYELARTNFRTALELQPDLRLASVLAEECGWRLAWQELGRTAAEVLDP